MLIGRIEGANLDLGKPVDWDAANPTVHCGSLPVRRMVLPEGGTVMVSAWFPTPAELELLQRGRPVYLSVWGGGHPPVSLYVEPAT